MRQLSFSLIVSLCVPLLFGATLFAQEPVFAGATTRDRGLRDAAKKIEESLASAFELTGGTSLIEGSTSTETTVRAEDVERLLGDARGRYLEGDFKGAVTRTQDAIERFEAEPAFGSDAALWALYGELMLVKALAENRINKSKSDDTFRVLAAIRPDYVPDPGLTPPDVSSRFSEIAEEVAERASTLVVETNPAGAEVFVDGASQGRSPVTMTLPNGLHFISAKGLKSAKRRIELDKDTTLTLSTGDPRAKLAPEFIEALQDGAARSELEEISGAIGENVFSALVREEGDSLDVLLGRFVDGELSSVSALEFRSDLSDVDDAALLLAQSASEAQTDGWVVGERDAANLRDDFAALKTKPKTNVPDEGEGISPLVWVGVGTGVVAVTAAVVVGAIVLSNQQPNNPGKVNVRLQLDF